MLISARRTTITARSIGEQWTELPRYWSLMPTGILHPSAGTDPYRSRVWGPLNAHRSSPLGHHLTYYCRMFCFFFVVIVIIHSAGGGWVVRVKVVFLTHLMFLTTLCHSCFEPWRWRGRLLVTTMRMIQFLASKTMKCMQVLIYTYKKY